MHLMLIWEILSVICETQICINPISVVCFSAVFEVGGQEILIQQLYESCSRTVANAAATLCNMAQYEVIRRSILSHGAMSALVEPLKSTDTQVLVNTTQCLAVLVCETEAKTEVWVSVNETLFINYSFLCDKLSNSNTYLHSLKGMEVFNHWSVCCNPITRRCSTTHVLQ